jgi:hypothetical protein
MPRSKRVEVLRLAPHSPFSFSGRASSHLSVWLVFEQLVLERLLPVLVMVSLQSCLRMDFNSRRCFAVVSG